jgi:hypothetical protein
MKKCCLILSVLIFTVSCNNGVRKNNRLFSLMPSSRTNIDFINQLAEDNQSNMIEYLYFNNGGGVAAGDINNDGLADLYFTSNQNSNKLYLNKGDFRFEDITEKAGVGGTGNWTTGVTMEDVNGDGLLDIYICHVGNYKNFTGKNQLFINKGNLTFKDEAQDYGLDFQGFSTQAAFFDYDMDGDLDMYLLNHSVHTSRSYGSIMLRNDWDARAGDRLFRNEEINGKQLFRDVTTRAGIFSSQIGYGLGINICDINNDGYPDIYISNDFHENDYLYINNQDGTFSEHLTEFIAHTSRSSMGNDVGDINNDGLLDIMVLDMLPDEEKIRKQSGGEDDFELSVLKLAYGYGYQFVRNTLQLNLGGGMFSEIGRLAGVYSTDWSWSPLFCDVDNDGWKDILITNGIYRRANDLDYIKFLTEGNNNSMPRDLSGVPDKVLYEKMPLHSNVNFIFRNNGDLTFSNMAHEWGFKIKSYSNGATYADLDNDGDLDLIINNINQKAFIYRNNARQKLDNHFLSVALKGSEVNYRGTGSRIILFSGGQQQVAEQYPTWGFISATTGILHFGLGNSKDQIDSLLVRWPDNSEQVLRNVKPDQFITLDIKNAVKHPKNNAKEQEKMQLLTRAAIPGLTFTHKEDQYTDLYREGLSPHSLSAEGPPLAAGDLNGDGLEDLFIGGAKGQAAGLFIQQKDGTFRPAYVPVLSEESNTEDVDAAIFDADNDGDFDLYIVRGGNELPVGNPGLTDRLLINDGNAGFSKAEFPALSHNGSCVRACDFDNDGDSDLFLGSRSVPGAYGWSPGQYLLKNDGNGIFKDVTEERMKELKDIGMVTDACWADIDRDGDPDLILAGEWMKVSVLRNDNGFFTDVTDAAGLSQTSGWWNCISAFDIDGDGDIDLAGGNMGLNSLLKASPEKPVEMYLNDFDNNGSLDQIICSYQGDISYPVAPVDEIAAQITGFKNRYPNYSDYGGKTVRDLFGKKIIDQSTVKKAVMAESALFLNNGDGTFRIKKLPVYAQFSPVRDIFFRDLDKDGKPDIILVGNDYNVRPSFGRYDASYGWCIMTGKNNYHTLMPDESGLKVRGDARRICLLSISGKNYLVVSVNNGSLQIFRIL